MFLPQSDLAKRGLPSAYDRHCRGLDKQEAKARMNDGQPFVVRFKAPLSSGSNGIIVDDLVRGRVTFGAGHVDDAVLLKTDSHPTYHLASVVDDHEMQISHVLRGEEWLSSAPKHALLFKAFDWEPPAFAHLPLLLNSDRAKLSKRQQHASVSYYMEQGFLPEAVINFVALLGWNPKTTKEIFTLDELVEQFSLEGIQKGGAVVDEQRMRWMNREHLRLRVSESEASSAPTRRFEELIQAMRDGATRTFPSLSGTGAVDADRLARFIPALIEHVEIAEELGYKFPFIFFDPDLSNESATMFRSSFWTENTPSIVNGLRKELATIEPSAWTADEIKRKVKAVLKREGKLPFRAGLQPLRLAVTGVGVGPSIVDIAEIMEKETVLRRLDKLLETIDRHNEGD